MSPDTLLQYQKQQKINLLQYAFAHVPHYRRIFELMNISGVESITADIFENFPILTKNIIKTYATELLSQDDSLKNVDINMTGGSTGTPLVFYQDAEYRAASIGAEKCILNWWGVSAGDRTTSFWGADRELKDWSFRERCMMWLDRENIFDSFAMSEAKMEKFAKVLVKWKPIYIKGYASSLYLFARFLLENRQYKIRPIAIRSTAETLFDFQRKDIEEAFASKVYNFYGSREVNNLAAECIQQDGLHILSGTRIVEVLDANNRPAPCGEIGRIVVTDLVNRAMPFIRYENGDLGIMSDDAPCNCNLPYPRLKEVIGRVSDILVGDQGQYVHGEFITHLFYGLPGVLNFQIMQHDLYRLELIIQLVEKEKLPDLTQLQAKIRERLGNISISTTLIDRFDRNSSGKHRFIISKVSPFNNSAKPY
jgi:phenylacetate-CoA ligase